MRLKTLIPDRVLTRARCQVRRAKLYYLRDRVGKAARLKQEFMSAKVEKTPPPTKAAAKPVEAAAAS